MSFDAAVYTALKSVDPAAAAAYLAEATGSAPATPAAPQFPAHTQPYRAPQAQPAQPLNPALAQSGPAPVRGSLASGWDQGSRAGGYGEWVKFPEEGHVFSGVVARDMVDADCNQVIDPGTKQPKFFKNSGAPQLRFVIALDVQPSPLYPEGKATLSTDKYKLHSAVVRAMMEQGYAVGEGLHEGDLLTVQRLANVQSGMGNPGHDFQASVVRAGSASAPAAPAPVAPQISVQEIVDANEQVPASSVNPNLSATQQALVAKYTGQPA